MPGFDGTGPRGFGPRTGRGLGECGPMLGRGAGCMFRRGFGRQSGYREPLIMTKDEQKAILQAELEQIKEEEKAIQAKLKEL